MAVCFDLFCPECDHIIEDAMINTGDVLPNCPECDTLMRKMMGTTCFELKYDNRKDMCDWNGNTSQYWKDIKEKGGEEPVNKKQPEWW